MPYTAPTVDAFRTRLPEFDEASYSESAVAAALTAAGRQVDETWLEDDYADAIIYLAAHMLSVGGAGADALGQDDLRSISIGPLSLSYGDKLRADSLATTVYGQRFAQLRTLNVGGPVIV